MKRENAPREDRTLRADCERCFGLCCVAPAFSKSADFAADKEAGQPCPHLEPAFRCSIHADLRERGFSGCTVYDCFGAGQKVSQVTFSGKDWRSKPRTAAAMFGVFATMRQLHELLWHLAEALKLTTSGPLHAPLGQAFDATERLTQKSARALLALDVDSHHRDVNALLVRTSKMVRAGVSGPKKSYRGADLVGADLRGRSLRGANLRGARLIGSDLRDADLTLADLTGADLRGADLRGADLTSSIFVTQAQLNAARGDTQTKVPPSRTRPSHWSPVHVTLRRK